jgi:hypothetical protein
LAGLAVGLAAVVFLRRNAAARQAAKRAAQNPPSDFMHLKAGQRYVVVRAFTDYDGATHPVGETWTYLRHNYVPYHNGLSLFVRGEDGADRQIRLSWRGEDQGPIIDALADYVQPAEDPGTPPA